MRCKRTLIFFLLLLLLVPLGGCAVEEEAASSSSEEVSEEVELTEYPTVVQGVTIRSRPSRVVSLSPALTEKLYDIGLEEALVGVSDYCDYPIEAAGLPKCGTALLPNLERIADLNPHVILAQTELAEEDLIALQQMDADVVIIPPAADVAAFKDSYRSLARLLEGEYAGAVRGDKFAKNLQDRLDAMAEYLIPYAEANGVKKALYLRLLDFNVATGDTLESELLGIIGLENIAADQTGWLYPEELANGEGRAAFESAEVFFMDENFVTIKMLEQSPYYKGLQATLKDWYLYIDALVFERQSLRMLDILAEMAAYAYPEAVPALPLADPDSEAVEEPDGEASDEDSQTAAE
jgi:iron complex transport system substrate-binding protein